LAADVFTWWYRVRDGALQRSTLRTYIDSQRPRLRDLLQRGTHCRCTQTATFCANLLDVAPALWTFVRADGVEPTNHAAERALRPAVLWRRRSFGCQSPAGCRFVERLLTVVQALRLHQRGVIDDLAQAMTAHRQGLAAPKLLPTLSGGRRVLPLPGRQGASPIAAIQAFLPSCLLAQKECLDTSYTRR
jgi:transposase